MAKTVVTALEDWRKISELSGGDPSIIMHEPATNELECPDVTQPALDAGHIAYTADQVNIDAATAAARLTSEQTLAKNNVDVERVVRALVDLLPAEFNILRTLHSLADRTPAQVNAALKANIDAQS